jgi:hypothetical protein
VKGLLQMKTTPAYVMFWILFGALFMWLAFGCGGKPRAGRRSAHCAPPTFGGHSPVECRRIDLGNGATPWEMCAYQVTAPECPYAAGIAVLGTPSTCPGVWVILGKDCVIDTSRTEL